MTPDRPDPLDAVRATRAQLDYVMWDAALGLLALAVGPVVVALPVASRAARGSLTSFAGPEARQSDMHKRASKSLAST